MTRRMEKARAKTTGIDRLSDLPDVPLLHILSYLRSKEAVRTSILSKRWRGLWAYIRSVHFHYAEFRNQEGKNEEQKFLNFVNSFLILRKISVLDSFRLEWFHPDTNPVIASTWIRRAVECKPRLVDIYLCGLEPLEVPHSLFACSSVEVMVLGFCSHTKETVIRPKSADLPCLRSLKVICVSLGNDFVEKFAQGCPVLEEVVMLRCKLEMSTFSNFTLRSLIIERCQVQTEVCISIPTLVSLQINEVELGMIWLSNMSSLRKADVTLRSFNFDATYKKSKYELLSGLSNATDVKLRESRGVTQVRGLLAKELPKCPKFKNLRSLLLNECLLCQDYNLIARLIHLAPNLLKLTVTVKENFVWDTEEELLEEEEVSKLEMPQKFPNCRQLHVKILYRKNERGAKELAKMLMENIKILKKISIGRW